MPLLVLWMVPFGALPDVSQLTPVVQSLVGWIQAIGFAIVVIFVALIAVMVLTSFGNEHRLAIAKAAAVSVVVGLVLLASAFFLASVLQRMFPILQ